MPTLLAIHAHPDDESSKGAATVARYASQGVKCVLVTATGGEAGDILNPAMDLPEVRAHLAAVRRRELAEAAQILGYQDVIELGYRDSGMAGSVDNDNADAFVNSSFDATLARLVAIVRRLRPDVVLGYDEHEYYPHPDHIRVHDLSLALPEAAADEARFPAEGDAWSIPRLYAPVFTRRRILALHEAMKSAGLESPFDRWLAAWPPERGTIEPDAQVNVRGFVDRGRDALRAHRTQVDPDGFWFQVPTEMVETTYPYEDFKLIAAASPIDPPVTDLFAGL